MLGAAFRENAARYLRVLACTSPYMVWFNPLQKGNCMCRFTRGPISIISVFLIYLLIIQALPTPVRAQEPNDSNPPFRIVVIEGEGSINNIKQPVNRGMTVLVEDENKNPLSGVSVSFFLPSDGPSGLFPNGSRVLTVFTDQRGVATSRTIRFNNLVGLMRVDVNASLFSENANALITQTNISSAAALRSPLVPAAGVPKVPGPPHPGRKKLLIIAAAAAAAGVAVYFLTRKGPPTASVTIGPPSVSGPTQ
jgi:hypothetical protein